MVARPAAVFLICACKRLNERLSLLPASDFIVKSSNKRKGRFANSKIEWVAVADGSLAVAPATARADDANVNLSAAAPGTESDAALAQQLQNPVAALISVPFQNNVDFGIGANKVDRYLLNIQPVVPFSLNAQWNLISRTIAPVINLPSIAPGVPSQFGLGDVTESLFLSPKAAFHGVILGAGPIFLLPTATETALGADKFGMGPTLVALAQQNGFTYGILANQLWSVAGDAGRPAVNASFLQPFLSFTWNTGTSLTVNTESTYDWIARQWTVPINLLASQVIKIGRQPLSLSLGGREYAVRPGGGADWGIRFAVTFLFPA